MTETGDRLREMIERDGPIPVSAFMQTCLAGYYGKGDVFGRQGDFITAPEISQVFGELIGLWAAVVWQMMGQPPQVRLVEMGPGRGTLMKDLLRAAEAVEPFRAALDIHLIETSPGLRDIQRETLSGLPLTWHDRFEDLPEGPMILVANELFDALPIEQYERTSEGWCRRCVAEADGAFHFAVGEPVHTDAIPTEALTAPEGALVEICPAGRALAAALGRRLSSQGGAALIVDYGYLKSGACDTLQALRDHAFAPVLEVPGAADLTAHVDFQALAEAAVATGARADGPVLQGTFLRRLGIEMRTAKLIKTATPEQANLLGSGCRRLIHPDGMGELFKVLALSAPDLTTLPGFEDS